MAENGKKILVVDDSDMLREELEEGLHNYGFECCLASDGEEALRIAEECRPDLVILDMIMPRMSGLEVATRLREMDTLKRVPIIMLTGRWSVRDKMAGYQCGVNRYLTKPMEISALVEEINQVLRNKSRV